MSVAFVGMSADPKKVPASGLTLFPLEGAGEPGLIVMLSDTVVVLPAVVNELTVIVFELKVPSSITAYSLPFFLTLESSLRSST